MVPPGLRQCPTRRGYAAGPRRMTRTAEMSDLERDIVVEIVDRGAGAGWGG
jgi:hypothetical protein